MRNCEGALHSCFILTFEMEISSLLLVFIHDCVPGQRCREHLQLTSRQLECLRLQVHFCPSRAQCSHPKTPLASPPCQPRAVAPWPPSITSHSHKSMQRDLSHLRCTLPLSRKVSQLTNMLSTQWALPSYF